MEDQPADSGDLTTDTAETDEASAANARRRRMPLRGQLASSEESHEDAATDAEAEPSPRRRWWNFRRQREVTKPTVDETTGTTAESAEPEEAKPQPRTPVGKSGRTATSVAPVEPVEEPDESGEAPESDVILVPHRPAGKRLKIAAVAAAALFVGAVAFAAATLQPYLADRAMVDTKLNVARTAANAITTLWTYTPDNMDSLPDRSATYLGGDFANEYRKYIDAIVAPNKQAQVTNTTQVMGAAVETLTPSEATAIVYTNSVATSPVTKNIPSLRYLSYRLTMQRHDAKWLITKMSTVTSLDLTPRL